MQVKTGIEMFMSGNAKDFRGAKAGAVIHPASVLSDLRHTADALMECRHVQLAALFGPQHGARGEQQDNMIESAFYRDSGTGLPVYSLYGDTRRPTEEMLSGIDLLLFDLQDVGTRVYTFISTMAFCMEACARWGRRMVVLDRPNPINGVQVEGNPLEMDCRSFVGLYPIPMRHGMTVGELALLFNSEFDIGCDLTIVEMEGWKRKHWFDQTGLPWIMPSPNLPTLDSAVVYPGAVLLEGACLSEGRGTTRPFELIGAPFISGKRYAGKLNALDLPGVRFRPVNFLPTFQKWAGAMCGGVQIHVQDRDAFASYLTGISLLSTARALYPESFAWRNPPYEYEYDKLPIEILCGSRSIPEMIVNGTSLDVIRESWRDELEAFLQRRSRYLLY